MKDHSEAERLERQTDKFLHESQWEIRDLGLSEQQARRNISDFFENLSQFNDADCIADPSHSGSTKVDS